MPQTHEQKLNFPSFQGNLGSVLHNNQRGGATGDSDDNSSVYFDTDELDESSNETSSIGDYDSNGDEQIPLNMKKVQNKRRDPDKRKLEKKFGIQEKKAVEQKQGFQEKRDGKQKQGLHEKKAGKPKKGLCEKKAREQKKEF